MIGILVQLAVSWLIIWLFEKGNLSFLGLYPTKQRIIDFFFFLLVTAFCCATEFLFRMYFGKEQWTINPAISFSLIVKGLWWNIKSVLFEELIFRGVLFYILLKKLGAAKAIIISASAFGMYHWFSQESWGNITQMAITFVITGIMGLVYAYGYAKTYSLYIPCAIHIGWNATRSVLFSDKLIGDQFLVQVKPVPVVSVSYFAYFLVFLFPLVSAIVINYLLLKKRKQVIIY